MTADARRLPAFPVVAGAALVAAVAALVAYDARWHEYWRDEVHTYLFNEHVPLHRFLVAKRAEGHPPLYDLVTVPLVPFLPATARILVGGAVGFAVLLAGTFRCLLSLCGRRWASLALTGLLACTYVYAYELGVVVRCYGLGAGFALLTSAFLRDAVRSHSPRPVALGAACGGLCLLTSTHAATLAAGCVAAFGLVSLWRHRGIRIALPTLATLPCLALLAYEISPFPGRSSELNVDLHRDRAQFVKMALQAIGGSFTPQDWWVTASFGAPGTLDAIAIARHWGTVGVLAALVLSVGLRLLPAARAYRPMLAYDVLSLLIGWAGLLEIVVDHYWGSPRHHVFFSLPAVVLATGWALQRRRGGWRWAHATALPLLAAWFVFQIWVGARDLALDVDLPFSDTKAAAALLPPDAHVVADSLTMEEGIMLWQPGVRMRGGDDAGRSLGYVAFDNAWHTPASVPSLVGEECRLAPDRTYLAGARGWLGACGRLLRTATPHSEQLRPDERFDLSQVDCDCLRRGR